MKEQARKHNAVLQKENEALLVERKIYDDKQENMHGEAIQSKRSILNNLRTQINNVEAQLNELLGKLK